MRTVIIFSVCNDFRSVHASIRAYTNAAYVYLSVNTCDVYETAE